MGAAAGVLVMAMVKRSEGVLARAQEAAVQGRLLTAASAPAAVLTRYCVTCHNPRLKTAGFVIDPAGLASVETGAEGWEKVVRKLRSNSMPPLGAPRPDQATYDLVAASLESLTARQRRARVWGKLPLLHRLTRTEYQNAVRDLRLAAPEGSRCRLLPPDNISSGLTTSPTAVCVAQQHGAVSRRGAEDQSSGVGDPRCRCREHPQAGCRTSPGRSVDELPFAREAVSR
jgi:hypothetical protein